MRSVLASFWLLTVSVGNLITLVIAESKSVANQVRCSASICLSSMQYFGIENGTSTSNMSDVAVNILTIRKPCSVKTKTSEKTNSTCFFQGAEYILFAGLMGIATIIFIFLARRYKYVDENEFYETENDPLDGGRENNENVDEWNKCRAVWHECEIQLTFIKSKITNSKSKQCRFS